jgi:hypothetical protein
MEGAVILPITLLGVGGLFIWLGVFSWKHRREERITLIETAILKAGDADPFPRNRYDRAMAYIHPILMLILGPVMIFLGLILLLS